MIEKEITFDDNSFARFTLDNKTLCFFIQARMLGKENAVTSTTVSLTKEETLELINWLAEEITK